MPCGQTAIICAGNNIRTASDNDLFIGGTWNLCEYRPCSQSDLSGCCYAIVKEHSDIKFFLALPYILRKRSYHMLDKLQ